MITPFNVIILRVLSFLTSFDVIIFSGQQMLSFSLVHFLCYHLCYHLLLSWYYIMKNDNILYNQKDNIKEFKNDNI